MLGLGYGALTVQSRDLRTKPLRVALVGCGRWGSCIASTLASLPEFDLAWVCDKRATWANAAWAPTLSDEVCRDVEAVLVATPPEDHFEPTIFALKQKRAVFVEKPFMTSVHEANVVASLVGDTTLMVGHLLLFHPLHDRLQREHQAGTLGEIANIRIKRQSPDRGNPRCPWWTLAPHDLSLLVRVLGEPSYMHVERTPNGRDVHALLRFGAVDAHLEYSTNSNEKHRTWWVETTTKQLELDEARNSWAQVGMPEEVLASEPTPLAVELRHFAQCVAFAHKPAAGLNEALSNVALLCAGHRTLTRSEHAFRGETVFRTPLSSSLP